MTTPYHAKYFAHELTRQAQPGGVDRLSMALFDACVDLNPHQIKAAMFALWKQHICCCQFQQRGDLQRLRPVSFPAAPATACFLRRASIH
jgi:hypothetical protein